MLLLFLRLKQEPILIKKIISSEQRLNYVAAFFLFFFPENAKNLGQSDDAKQRKKEDGLKLKLKL